MIPLIIVHAIPPHALCQQRTHADFEAEAPKLRINAARTLTHMAVHRMSDQPLILSCLAADAQAGRSTAAGAPSSQLPATENERPDASAAASSDAGKLISHLVGLYVHSPEVCIPKLDCRKGQQRKHVLSSIFGSSIVHLQEGWVL